MHRWVGRPSSSLFTRANAVLCDRAARVLPATPFDHSRRGFAAAAPPDHYATLGVSPGVSADALKKAYRLKALQVKHPP